MSPYTSTLEIKLQLLGSNLTKAAEYGSINHAWQGLAAARALVHVEMDECLHLGTGWVFPWSCFEHEPDAECPLWERVSVWPCAFAFWHLCTLQFVEAGLKPRFAIEIELVALQGRKVRSIDRRRGRPSPILLLHLHLINGKLRPLKRLISKDVRLGIRYTLMARWCCQLCTTVWENQANDELCKQYIFKLHCYLCLFEDK